MYSYNQDRRNRNRNRKHIFLQIYLLRQIALGTKCFALTETTQRSMWEGKPPPSAPLCQEYEKRGKPQESKLSNWYLPRVLVIGANAIISLKFSTEILWFLPYQWMQTLDRILNPVSNLKLTYSILDLLKNTDHLHTVVLQRHWT